MLYDRTNKLVNKYGINIYIYIFFFHFTQNIFLRKNLSPCICVCLILHVFEMCASHMCVTHKISMFEGMCEYH